MQWWPQPAAGEFVWCRFPEDLRLTPGSKPRPALIMTVFDDEAPAYRVCSAYGTSQKIKQLYSGEFAITEVDGPAYKPAGLSYPIKFNLKRLVELPYNDEWFSVAPGIPHGQTPKLGVLHPSVMHRVKAAWNAVQKNE